MWVLEINRKVIIRMIEWPCDRCDRYSLPFATEPIKSHSKNIARKYFQFKIRPNWVKNTSSKINHNIRNVRKNSKYVKTANKIIDFERNLAIFFGLSYHLLEISSNCVAANIISVRTRTMAPSHIFFNFWMFSTFGAAACLPVDHIRNIHKQLDPVTLRLVNYSSDTITNIKQFSGVNTHTFAAEENTIRTGSYDESRPRNFYWIGRQLFEITALEVFVLASILCALLVWAILRCCKICSAGKQQVNQDEYS